MNDMEKLVETEDERDTLLGILAPLAVAAQDLHRELFRKGYRSENMGRVYDALSGIRFLEEESREFCDMCRRVDND